MEGKKATRKCKKRRGGYGATFRCQNQGHVPTEVVNDPATVINLSNLHLTEDEKSTLTLGLSFCTRTNFNHAQTRIDFYKFVRKLKKKKKIHTQTENSKAKEPDTKKMARPWK